MVICEALQVNNQKEALLNHIHAAILIIVVFMQEFDTCPEKACVYVTKDWLILY